MDSLRKLANRYPYIDSAMSDAPLVVFDLDGTLVDSRRDLTLSVNAMLDEFGAPPLPEANVTRMVGEGARVLVERAVASAGLSLEETPRALERFLAIYDLHLLDHTHPYEGVPNLLSALTAAGARAAVLTNKPRDASVRILQGLRLFGHFIEIVGGDGPYGRKPDPDALLHLMDAAGAARDRTTLVGDSRIDLETARNAGVPCCLVSYGFGFGSVGSAPPGDYRVVDRPEEIVALVTGATGTERSLRQPPR